MGSTSGPVPMQENGSDTDKVSLPTADLVQITSNVSLLPPLTRQGHGPGLILVLPSDAPVYPEGGVVCVEGGIPPPLLKWAEEGFAVVEIRAPGGTDAGDSWGKKAVEKAFRALKDCKACDIDDGVGMVVYGASLWGDFVDIKAIDGKIAATVIYGVVEDRATPAPMPLLFHTPESPKAGSKKPAAKTYAYPTAKSSNFVLPKHPDFQGSSEAIAHTRNLTFLKRYIRGLDFDLEAIWEEHTFFEFAERSVPKTMATMVQEPYVNNTPTLTGGIGRAHLTHFYTNHFIPKNPKDTDLVVVSRTIGIDRVCDEFVATFTHDMEMDWLAPGIPATGRKVELAVTSVVCVRGDRLYHEHISWCQASLLIQLGLLPEYLPYPHPLPDGRTPGPGKRFEYRVPAAGIEASKKMLDKNSVPSNGMLEYKVREVNA